MKGSGVASTGQAYSLEGANMTPHKNKYRMSGICIECSKPFSELPPHIKIMAKRKFCSKSCGARYLNRHNSRAHGLIKTGTYYSWSAMVQRIHNPRCPKYPFYGGRGIDMDPRWRSFTSFLMDMGEKPKGCSIGRIENNKGYWKYNCRWENAFQQASNTSRTHILTCEGQSHTIAQWSRIVGLCHSTLIHRLKRGLSVKEVLFQPSRYSKHE